VVTVTEESKKPNQQKAVQQTTEEAIARVAKQGVQVKIYGKAAVRLRDNKIARELYEARGPQDAVTYLHGSADGLRDAKEPG
jgi:hypothetical protein